MYPHYFHTFIHGNLKHQYCQTLSVCVKLISPVISHLILHPDWLGPGPGRRVPLPGGGGVIRGRDAGDGAGPSKWKSLFIQEVFPSRTASSDSSAAAYWDLTWGRLRAPERAAASQSPSSECPRAPWWLLWCRFRQIEDLISERREMKKKPRSYFVSRARLRIFDNLCSHLNSAICVPEADSSCMSCHISEVYYLIKKKIKNCNLTLLIVMKINSFVSG